MNHRLPESHQERQFRTDADTGKKFRQSSNSLLEMMGIRRQKTSNDGFAPPRVISPLFMM